MKMSATKKGRPPTPAFLDSRIKVGLAQKGRKLTEEWKAAIKLGWVKRRERAAAAKQIKQASCEGMEVRQ